MRTEELSTEGLSARIRGIVGKVHELLERETGENYDERLVEDSIRACVQRSMDRLSEDMLEMFTSPARREYQELAALLEERHEIARAAVAVEEMVHIAQEHGDESVFEGFRPFSHSKLSAMIEYLTAKGRFVYKTSLNKLLFYSDLTYFYLRDHGMSGAVYHNRPYGPVADAASPALTELINNERITVDPRTKTLKAVAEPGNSLTEEERRVLDWVLVTYGAMTAGEISNVSHSEMAYRYTDPNEPIAYAYAKFFKQLPPKSLLDQ